MSLLKVEAKKALLLFFVLFITWHIIYFANWVLNGIDWLLAYSLVLVVLVCFFVLDKQKLGDLGLERVSMWKRYVLVGFLFAIFIILAWAGISLVLPTTFHEIFNYGVWSIPYNALFALVVGLVEETSFRGYILRNLRSVCSDAKAIVYSSVLFGLYHISFVSVLLSTTPTSQTFTFWSSYVLFTFVVGSFLGYFSADTQQTTIGTISHHSSHIFLSSLIPIGLATSFTIGHLVSTSAYLIVFPFLILLKRKGWLSHPSS